MNKFPKKEFKPYPDGGKLRASTSKRGQMSPDYWGDIAINMNDMTNIKKDGDLLVVKLSGWKKQDASGKTYLSIAVDRYVPKEEAQSKPAVQLQDDDLDF